MSLHRITRTALGPLAAAAVLTLSACSGGGGAPDTASDDAASEPTSQESASESSSDGAADTTEPAESTDTSGELAGVPDVVAEVNGEEVTKEELAPVFEARLQQALAQAQAGGQAPDTDALMKETVENLVDTELLAQEAASRGISVTDEDVEAELGELAEQYQLESADALLSALEERGTTAEEAREQVRSQVAVEQLVEDEAGPLEPTEKELRKLYADAEKQAAQQGGSKLPSFSEVRSQLEQRATSEQVGEVAQELVAELREDADITLNLG